ncbi:hypothetical protein L21SP2_2535 [Salinispira pacifica]|uniref:Uncharacterized protein n=1 Tax=Salinispira pacifica TaxID=1307761 RepID=V5WJ79_9SPIO|nr:hypothetical protein L21SP2_2535 [Salinispira pacifica]
MCASSSFGLMFSNSLQLQQYISAVFRSPSLPVIPARAR